MKLLGMIGGTSWHSTVEYYRMINEGVVERTGQNPELLLHSINSSIMAEGKTDRIQAKYLDVARSLENAGAKAILICANTPHLVYDEVHPKIGIPILHIADATGREAQGKGLNKLGLLGTLPTMEGEFISGPLQNRYGIETILPREKHRERSHAFIARELTKGVFSDQAKRFFVQRMEELKTDGAEGIILGCTELPILLKQEDFDLPLLDTTKLHARMGVEFILS